MGQLGSWSAPWQMTATIIEASNPDAYLHGDVTVNFYLGWANFTNIAISHSGVYKLQFALSASTAAIGQYANYTADVTIEPIVLEARVASQPTEVIQNETIRVLVDLVDLNTGMRLDEIGWKVER